MICDAADELLGVGGVCVGVGVGKLLCGGVSAGEGTDAVGLLCAVDVVGVLFVGPGTAVRAPTRSSGD